ncbi:MAG: ATP-binding protein, partial [Methyloligellaceae bacterium]
IIWTVEQAALVFCIDQVEDLRNFEDPEDRFTKAVGNLMQIANRVPSSIVIISVLEEFYGQARAVLHQSYIDRIEKAGPVALYENRTAEEARLIIGKRLEYESLQHSDGPSYPDSSSFFAPEFFEEFAGLSTRRLLEHAQNRVRASGDEAPVVEDDSPTGFISTLASALGFAPDNDEPTNVSVMQVDYREMWDRFCNSSEAEIPSDDQDLLDVLAGTLTLASAEWDGELHVTVTRPEIADDMPVIDMLVRHPTGHSYEARVYLCNRPTQGGGLKRQLDKVLATMQGRTCFMLRASDFPPNKKNQTAQAYRKFRDAGGRAVLVPIPEWERMLAIREFHMHHRNDPGFGDWFEKVRLVSGLISVMQLLRLDLLGKTIPTPGAAKPAAAAPVTAAPVIGEMSAPSFDDFEAAPVESFIRDTLDNAPPPATTGSAWADWTGWNSELTPTSSVPANDDILPLPVILDEAGGNENSIFAGRQNGTGRAVTLNKSIMKRHAAFLGGSGSGKTTIALSLIEQLLSRGIPAVLIDRKGDLCSYANPEVWRSDDYDGSDRVADREKLADSIDVAVYTPGRSSGRPISITLLPTGMNELPEHEQTLLANLSSAALGDMLHLKNSATHQKQSGTLSVALRILGSRSAHEVTLSDLIAFLEDEDAELTDLTQRMDPSGKIRRDLVAQLDSLRFRNTALFEGGGESLR